MGKSNWLSDGKQAGNFSNKKQDTFDPKKRYVGIRLQQGVPLLDRDWNELEDIRRYAEMTLGKYYIGNGTPDDGFEVSLIKGAVLDFEISSGRCLVDGFDVVNDPYDESGAKLDLILYSRQEDVPAITSFIESRTDTVYLDVWVEEVSAVRDIALKNSQDIDMETCRRHKLEWRVRVDEGSKGYEKVLFHHYYDLAKINWSTANVEDLRVTGLKVLQLREEVELLKDHAGKHTHSKLVGEGGAPDPALQVDQNGNVGIGTVDPGKKLDVNGDIRANNFYKLLPHNIISNSFMNRLNGNVPIGFTIGSYNAGTSWIQIEAVHPFTKGFEGPYRESKPNGAVDNVDDATGSKPYWFGSYWKGPRAARGGLADGWMGRRDGHILKITGKRYATNGSEIIYVMFPKEQRVLTARLLFRAWVKITKGAIDFGTDMGVKPQITRAMTKTAPQGWYFINRIFESSHVTDIGGESFIFKCLGEEANHVGDFEIYLALPYLANIEIEDSPHWSPSILDILSDYGATIDFVTGNVGIGTTEPKGKLDVNGNIVFNGSLDNQMSADGILTKIKGKAVLLDISPNGGGQLLICNNPDDNKIFIEGFSSDTSGSASEILITGRNGQSVQSFSVIAGKTYISGNVGIGTRTPTYNLHTNGTSYADKRAGGGIDYAEYFESKNGKEIKPGTSVVLDGDKIRPAKKGENPFGAISANPGIVGGVHIEWPKKYLKDEFGNQIMEEYQEEIMTPKKEKKKKERRKIAKKTIKEKVIRTEIEKIKGKYCQKEIIEIIEREIEEPVFEEVDLYDAKGKQVIGNHRIPVMETYEEEIDVLNEKGQPVMIGTGKFETKTRPKINPEHDETKEYISREKRPEWNCVGLLGQLPLRKDQPVAPGWIKIKDLSKDVELWLVK